MKAKIGPIEFEYSRLPTGKKLELLTEAAQGYPHWHRERLEIEQQIDLLRYGVKK